MRKLKATRNLVRAERVLLVAVILPDEERLEEENIRELRGLAATAGAKVVRTVVQRRESPHPSSYVGTGKAAEIRDTARRLNADLVLVDHDLTPAQVRNLENIIKLKVVDRSELVLDIFSTHAKTTQAKLQVELAQLEYMMPRLRRMWTHLARYEGGIGVRGPGETQLETDRRLVRKRITDLRNNLRIIEGRRKRQAEARTDSFTICLVGYTNAGKSSLMKGLTGADVNVSDTLFETLDTKTSTLEIGKNERVFISDTVGFIRNLPHHLVSSFHATLEEALQADLLLHVVDSSSPASPHHVDVVADVLGELGCDDKKVLVVFNKTDKEREPGLLSLLKDKVEDYVLVSATTGQGIELLRHKVSQYLDEMRVSADVTLSAADGRTQAYLSRNGVVHSRTYLDEKVRMELSIERRFLQKARKLNPRMHVNVLKRGETRQPVGATSG